MLVEAEPPVKRDLPHFDIVRQAAGEIIERRAPARLFQNAHIHLQAGEQFDRALGRPMPEYAADILHRHEALHDGARIIAGD